MSVIGGYQGADSPILVGRSRTVTTPIDKSWAGAFFWAATGAATFDRSGTSIVKVTSQLSSVKAAVRQARREPEEQQ